MDGLAGLLAGLSALLVALTGLVAYLRPRPAKDNDDDVAAWRERAIAAEQRADEYRDLWLGCERTRRAPPPAV